MIAIDTNVLVRYLVQDDKAQARIANELIDKCLAQAENIFLDNIVLCELVWVLSGVYNYDKAQLLLVITRILEATQFEFLNKSVLWLALQDFRNSSANFSDCLLTRGVVSKGCLEFATFDRKMKTLKYVNFLD